MLLTFFLKLMNVLIYVCLIFCLFFCAKNNVNDIRLRAVSEIEIEVKPNRDSAKDVELEIVNNNAQIFELKKFTSPPPILPNEETSIIDIGAIEIDRLFDNDLRQCPPPIKCKNAGIRFRMDEFEGLVNVLDKEEIILLLIQDKMLGLTPINIQVISIPKNKYNIKTSDFKSFPSLKLDMSNVGSGKFKGKIIVEYFLF